MIITLFVSLVVFVCIQFQCIGDTLWKDNKDQSCNDSLYLKIDTLCGNWIGTINIHARNQLCVGILNVCFNNAIQCSLNFVENDANNSPNIIEYPFQVEILDKSKPASGTLTIITRAGTELYQQFEYKPNVVITSTSLIDFGSLEKKNVICDTFWITNIGNKKFYIANIRAKNYPNIISVNPTNVVLYPGDTSRFSVCIRGDFDSNIVDTLLFSYAAYLTSTLCYDANPIEIRAKILEPNFHASDQNWGIVAKNEIVTNYLTLTNTGNVDVIVYDYVPKLNGPNFSNMKISLPLTIHQNDSVRISLDYTPNGIIDAQHYEHIDWITNASKTKLYSNLYGQGTNIGLNVTNLKWNTRVIDEWQINQGITEYIDTIFIENVGVKSTTITNIQLVGTDAQYFKLINVTKLPINVNEYEKNIPIVLSFIPIEILNTRDAERNYFANVKIDYTVGSNQYVVYSELSGTAVQPRLSATGYDFGSVQLGTSTIGVVTISNVDTSLINRLTGNMDGTLDMSVYELSIPADNPFVWTRNGQKTIVFSPSNIIKAGNSSVLYEMVTFNPINDGIWSSVYSIKYNGTQIVHPLLTGSAKQNSKLIATDVQLITWYKHSIDDVFVVTSTTDGVLEVGDPSGKDCLNFSIIGWTDANGQFFTNYKQIPVFANVPILVWVQFTPAFITLNGLSDGQNLNNRLPFRSESLQTNIEIKERISGVIDTVTITGDGKYLETAVYIPSTYVSYPGEYVDVFVYTKNIPQSIDSGNISQFKTKLSFDPKILHPINIITENTQTDGWYQTSYNFDNSGIIEMNLKNDNKIKLNESNYPIYGVRFQTLFDPNNNSNLSVWLYPYELEQENYYDYKYVIFNYETGSVVINVPCAGNLRSIDLKNSGYFIETRIPMLYDVLDVEYSIGISAPVEMYLINILGQITTLIDEFKNSGNHRLTADINDLPSGVYYLVFRSLDYVATPIKLVKQ